jgi:hypothetical protein
MALRDQEVHKAAARRAEVLVVPVITAIDLTDAVVYSFTPGLQVSDRREPELLPTKAGTVSAVIKIGTRTAASVVFTAATEVGQTLSTTLANIRGSAPRPSPSS